jgi:hypothetical protein
VRHDGQMPDPLWTPLSFVPGPLRTFEAVYPEGEALVRRPIIGVLIEEEVRLGPGGAVIRTGVTRSVMAEQADVGSRDIEAAGESVAYVGVFEVGQEPLAEFVERARLALAELDADDD